MNFTQAVQCSDDMPLEQQSPSYQTGQAFSTQDLQLDACRDENPSPAQRPENPSRQVAAVVAPNVPADIITIPGSHGTIQATGLARALQPGGSFIMGQEVHTTIFHGNGGAGASRKVKPIKNKYRITDSQEEPVTRHLDVISQGLAGDWRRLGRHLGLADSTLDQLRMDYQTEGQHEVNYRVLSKWKQELGPVTVHMLAKALAEIGRGDLADELCKG